MRYYLIKHFPRMKIGCSYIISNEVESTPGLIELVMLFKSKYRSMVRKYKFQLLQNTVFTCDLDKQKSMVFLH